MVPRDLAVERISDSETSSLQVKYVRETGSVDRSTNGVANNEIMDNALKINQVISKFGTKL